LQDHFTESTEPDSPSHQEEPHLKHSELISPKSVQ
jgi:hypothetical protein